jgi:hypothetical protein
LIEKHVVGLYSPTPGAHKKKACATNGRQAE